MRRSTVWALSLALAATGCRHAASPSPPEAAPARWRTWTSLPPDDITVPPPPMGKAAAAELAEIEPLVLRRDSEVAPDEYRPLLDWLGVMIGLIRDRAPDPPSASRAYALTSIAMHDAVVVAWHWKYVYKRQAPPGRGPVPSYPSEHAALAAAASGVLARLFPDFAASEALSYRFADVPVPDLYVLAERTANWRFEHGAEFRSDGEAGLALGRAVADRVIAVSGIDATAPSWDGKRPAGVGRGPEHWEPPPDLIGPPARPEAASWKPLAVTSASAFRPRPPPAYGSAQFVAEARELLALPRDATDAGFARFWSGLSRSELPPPAWMEVAENNAEGVAASIPHVVRTLAALAVAQYDATVAVWDAKYTYWSPRPLNAVRDLKLDPTWGPVLETPLSPSYPSLYAAYAGASETVLRYLLPGAGEGWTAMGASAADSRLSGGVQFRSDSNAGLQLGRDVGEAVVRRLRHDAGR